MTSSTTAKLAMATLAQGVLFVLGLFLLPLLWPESGSHALTEAIGVYGQIAMFALGGAGAGTIAHGSRHIGSAAPTSAMIEAEGEGEAQGRDGHAEVEPEGGV